MDQNQPLDDNALQQAIDNISSTTNTDPVFSEPVAAPSSIPEGDTGELGEPVGPFPMPEPEAQVGVVTPPSDPIAPIDPISLPELNVDGENAANATVITKPDSATNPTPEPQDQNSVEPLNDNPPISNENQPEAHHEATIQSENHTEQSFANSNPDSSNHTPDQQTNNHPDNMNARQIKEAALRDLVPILDRVNADPSQKFKICRDIFQDLHDYSVLDQAYRAASEIKNEGERADSLLYLIESIDSM